jgi:hypothetical protein
MGQVETPEGGGPVSTSAFSIALSPQGHVHVHVDLDVEAGSDLPPPLAEIAKHFERSDGHGVFRLGARRASTLRKTKAIPMRPSPSWRPAAKARAAMDRARSGRAEAQGIKVP